MGKYLKLFETHSQYTAFTQTEDFILPNVSYCKDQTDIVHYNPIVPPIQPLMVTYNVGDASQPTQLYFYMVQQGAPFSIRGVDIFDKVEIDGTEVSVADLDTASGAYQLSADEHTVKYTLKDPTIISPVLDESTGTYKVGAVFIQCTTITSVTIPNTVTSIGEAAFQGCSGLTSINIPNSVTSIGDGAFKGCTSLPVENNIRYADDTYLVGVTDTTLSAYTIKEGTKWIGSSAFYDCNNLTSITIPNTVLGIADSAFNDCDNLSSIEIPDSVTSIGRYAFASSHGLRTVTIGSGITNINDYAFNSCSQLAIVTVNATTPPTLGNSVFDGIFSPLAFSNQSVK